MADKRRAGGRVTPKGTSSSTSGARSTANPRREPDGAAPARVGRRPSSPLLLFAVALVWVAMGIISWTVLTAAWKVVPTILAVGIGALYMRGAVATVRRHEDRKP